MKLSMITMMMMGRFVVTRFYDGTENRKLDHFALRLSTHSLWR